MMLILAIVIGPMCYVDHDVFHLSSCPRQLMIPIVVFFVFIVCYGSCCLSSRNLVSTALSIFVLPILAVPV